LTLQLSFFASTIEMIPFTELLAKQIAAVVATGELMPGEIANKAIAALGIKRPEPN
jgi:hypothetical protein